MRHKLPTPAAVLRWEKSKRSHSVFQKTLSQKDGGIITRLNYSEPQEAKAMSSQLSRKKMLQVYRRQKLWGLTGATKWQKIRGWYNLCSLAHLQFLKMTQIQQRNSDILMLFVRRTNCRLGTEGIPLAALFWPLSTILSCFWEIKYQQEKQTVTKCSVWQQQLGELKWIMEARSKCPCTF